MVTIILGKNQNLILKKQFPMGEKALKAYKSLKSELTSETL